MKGRPLTLFGDDVQPEDLKAVGKSRATKKAKEEQEKEGKTTDKAKKTEGILDGWEGHKKYYSIGEVAALFKVRTSHIRFWTNEFALKVRTTRKGDRLYTPEQVKELKAIYHLVKEQGFTINGAKAKLKAHKKLSIESVDLKTALLQLRNKLLTIRNNLK
jgi:DNA-binding transcriptional MerR regulator